MFFVTPKQSSCKSPFLMGSCIVLIKNGSKRLFVSRRCLTKKTKSFVFRVLGNARRSFTTWNKQSYVLNAGKA
jgi:hypothetical protein